VGDGVSRLRREHRRDEDLEGVFVLVLGDLLDRRRLEAVNRAREPPHHGPDPAVRNDRLRRKVTQSRDS
jgi:hypothetical protein